MFRIHSLGSAALVGLAALGPVASATASDLKLNGQPSLSEPIGASLTIDLTGNPGLATLIGVNSNPGPTSVLGESIALGLDGNEFFLPGGVTDAAGLFSLGVTIPAIPALVGSTWHLVGVVFDPVDPNGLDFSNGASVTLTGPTSGFGQTELAGNSLGQRPFFEYVRAINMGSTVELSIDPGQLTALASATADLYVVSAKTIADWTSDPSLVDVSSGGAETVTFGAGGPGGVAASTFTVDPGTLNGVNGAQLGVGYDVVIDLDQDGTLSAGDVIDGYGDQAGFYVVHDIGAPGPYAVTESLYSFGSLLGQDLYYPSNVASLGRLPLVIIGHGNGHNYQWYDHIGYHLASYGFVVMSHTNNVGAGIDAASITTLDNTDVLLGNLAAIDGGALVGHVDSHRIAWVGHSRGGEGVARAYDRLYDGVYTPINYTLADILLVSSIAPTDYLGTDVSTTHTGNYHLWVGQADSDVSGCPISNTRQSYHLLDRAENQRQSISLGGVGHAWFHDNGGFPYAAGACLLDEPLTHAIMRPYILALMNYHLLGNLPARDYLTRQYESFRAISAPWTPCTDVNLQFRDGVEAGKFVIDDFQTNPATNLASSSATVSFDVADLLEGRMDDGNFDLKWDPIDPWNGFTQSNATDPGMGLVFSVDGSGDKQLAFDLLPGDADWTGYDSLSFRACQATRHPLTISFIADDVIEIELTDASGATSVIALDAYGGGIEEPYDRWSCGAGAGWIAEFETFRIQLTAFTADDPLFDLSSVDRLTFRFGPSHGASEGRYGFDDIELTKGN